MSRAQGMIVCAVCAAALLAGCQSRLTKPTLSTKDVELDLVSQQLRRIFRSQCLDDGMRVMAIGEIKNDTSVFSDDSVKFMMAQVASELADTGKVIISSAFSGKDGERPKDKVIPPSLMLNGKLTQHDFSKKDGQQQREFIFELSIVDLASGNRMWYGKSMVGFVYDGKPPFDAP